MELYTFDKVKNRSVKVGVVIGNTFVKKVNRKKHYLRMISGYAIQSDIVEKLYQLDIKQIKFIEDKSRTYIIFIEDFKLYSKKIDLKHGLQYAIPERYLKKEK